MRHNFLQRAAVFAENAIGQRDVEALHDFVERAVGVLRVFGPQAQMNLRFARRREDRGLHLRVAAVDRQDALLDVRFAQPGDANLAMNQAHAGDAPLQPRQNFFAKQWLQLARRPRQQRDEVAVVFQPQSRRGAARIRAESPRLPAPSPAAHSPPAFRGSCCESALRCASGFRRCDAACGPADRRRSRASNHLRWGPARRRQSPAARDSARRETLPPADRGCLPPRSCARLRCRCRSALR